MERCRGEGEVLSSFHQKNKRKTRLRLPGRGAEGLGKRRRKNFSRAARLGRRSSERNRFSPHASLSAGASEENAFVKRSRWPLTESRARDLLLAHFLHFSLFFLLRNNEDDPLNRLSDPFPFSPFGQSRKLFTIRMIFSASPLCRSPSALSSRRDLCLCVAVRF